MGERDALVGIMRQATIDDDRPLPLSYPSDFAVFARAILASDWLAAHDERVRASERDRLAGEVDHAAQIARAICDSEAFMWLMVGANHPEAHVMALRPAWLKYGQLGGGLNGRASIERRAGEVAAQ